MLIRFAPEDLLLFREASHDANPLHVSAEYARMTAYGEPVVFGILGAIAAAGCLQERGQRALSEAELEFCNPLFTGVDYRVEVRKDLEEEALILVYDADRLMAKSRYRFQTNRIGSAIPDAAGNATRSEAAVWSKNDLRIGAEIVGSYSPASNSLRLLVERWNFGGKGFHWEQLTALLWSSYFVGMELPGREAAFWKARIEFQPAAMSGEVEYAAQLQRLDERVDVLEISARLTTRGVPLARANLWAFLRPISPASSPSNLKAFFSQNQNLSGKVAVLVGGSRGLGSATALALAFSGCLVYVIYQQSKAHAERLQDLAAGASGQIWSIQGSAADMEFCRQLLVQINEQHGGIDILVCNACPPIQPLNFTPETIERIHRFVKESLELVTVPMCVFLPSLEKRSGWNVIISSEFVRTTPPHWPHYVTAKCAVEGLVSWAAAQAKNARFLVVRPPKLLTDQTNTPSGRHGAIPVERVAAAIASRLMEPAAEAAVEVLETFGDVNSAAALVAG